MMNLLDRWQQRKRQIEAAIANGRITPDEAARELAHLDYRIQRRALILKRRKDRKAWRDTLRARHEADSVLKR